MSRRSFCLALGIIVFLVCATGGVLIGLIRHQPGPFVNAPLPESNELQTEKSREFNTVLFSLLSAVGSEGDWDKQFTDEQINSYFEVDFVQSGMDRQMLRDGINKPRVVFESDRIRLAFRYGRGIWSSIISIDLRPWVPRCEPNVVALELEGFHAGALPISAQSLLERISEVGRQSGVDVTWYRRQGHPVALLRFQPDQGKTTVRLQAIEVKPGSIRIKIGTNDSTQPRAMLPPGDAALLHPLAD